VRPPGWWRREDSNLRHGAYETPALPPELRRQNGVDTKNAFVIIPPNGVQQ
jgi:hypothetical protein